MDNVHGMEGCGAVGLPPTVYSMGYYVCTYIHTYMHCAFSTVGSPTKLKRGFTFLLFFR